MKTRWLGPIGIVLLLAVALWLLLFRAPTPGTNTATRDTQTPVAASQPPASAAPSNRPTPPALPQASLEIILPSAVPETTPRPAAEVAAHLPATPETETGLPPLTVLENMRLVFRQYSSRFGGNPVGDNAEITAALNGRNPGQVTFVNPEAGQGVNDRGELVDNWGTPFFFHQISGTVMEIRSAGPDRKMWTADDLVLK